VRVRNVAHPVIKQAYSIFHLGGQAAGDGMVGAGAAARA
jgi:hypothetical protein